MPPRRRALALSAYAAALAIPLLLVVVAVAVFTLHRPPITGLVAGTLLVGAWSIFRALREERPEREPDGVPVDAERSPHLRGLAGGVDELRVALDAVARVDDEGGRRTLTVGLPYVAALDREALRALVAYGAAMGPEIDPLLLRARDVAMRVMLMALPPLRAPYRVLFRMLDAAIDEQVEARGALGHAGALAVVGEAASERSMEEAAIAQDAWPAFWHQHAVPALDAGVRPPLVEGFAAFLAANEAPVSGPDVRLVAEVAALEEVLLRGVARVEAGDLRPGGWDEEPETPPRAETLPWRPFTARLVRPLRTKIGALVLTTIVVAALVPMVWIFARAITAMDDLNDKAIAGGFALLTLLAIALLVRPRVRELRPAGRVRVDGHMLVVEHPVLLARPYAIPLERIRAVAVDDDGDERFAVHADSPWRVPERGGSDALGHLWERRLGSPLPLFDVTDHAPNVALVLDAPLLGPDVRASRAHGPQSGERLHGLLLRVDRPEVVAEAAGALRRLDTRDLQTLDLV